MNFTKQEVRDIKKYLEDFDVKNIKDYNLAQGQKITSIIMICHGHKNLHDSGYPLIKVIGVDSSDKQKGRIYYNLGYHDHVAFYTPVNIDTYGKNVYNVMNWLNGNEWFISKTFIPCSSLIIGTLEKTQKQGEVQVW